MRKRKLYLSELIRKYIPKAYQNIVLVLESKDEIIYHSNANAYFQKLDIPDSILSMQVKNWEVLHQTDIYIYL